MINVIDIVVAVLVLIYLVKNFGGILRTVKSVVIILCALIVFGILTSFIADWPILGPGQKYLKESFVVNLSYNIIKTIYPAIENSAPRLNAYMKDKFLSTPVSPVTPPKVPAFENLVPRMAVPDVPELQVTPKGK